MTQVCRRPAEVIVKRNVPPDFSRDISSQQVKSNRLYYEIVLVIHPEGMRQLHLKGLYRGIYLVIYPRDLQ